MLFKRHFLLVLLLSCLALVGCTAKTSYRFLDWVVAWSVDDYINWDRGQQVEFDSVLQQQLSWHQGTQLPRYSALLRRIRQDLEQPLNEDQLQQHLQQLGVLWQDVMLNLAPDAATLLAQISDEQAVELIENMDKKIAKAEQEYRESSSEELAERRIEGVEKTAKRFIGGLEKDQRELLAQWEQKLENSWPQWIASRKKWAGQLDVALQARRKVAFRERIEVLYVQPQTLWSEEYRRLSEVNTEVGIELVIALQGSLTDKQRRRLNKEIDYWIRAFDELAAEVQLAQH